MNKEYIIYINGVVPRKNSKEISSHKINLYCKEIMENVKIGENFVFRPLNFTNPTVKTHKEKSYQNKEMIYEKKFVEIIDHINNSCKTIVHIYIKENK